MQLVTMFLSQGATAHLRPVFLRCHAIFCLAAFPLHACTRSVLDCRHSTPMSFRQNWMTTHRRPMTPLRCHQWLKTSSRSSVLGSRTSHPYSVHVAPQVVVHGSCRPAHRQSL
jgi:hypothetical protein